jgi:hypothetical protein
VSLEIPEYGDDVAFRDRGTAQMSPPVTELCINAHVVHLGWGIGFSKSIRDIGTIDKVSSKGGEGKENA